MPTINDLRQQAATIKNATQVGENTATRVGTTFETIADLLEGANVGQGIPSVDLAQLNSLRTPADQTTTNPTVYNVTTLHNLSSTTIKVGTLFIFSDGGRAVVTQILLSNYQVDGGGNISSPNTSQITMYYRMFNIVQETWSAWTLYAGGGGGGTIDPYPVSGSNNAVASNGVFEGLQKAAPEVNINDIDDLDDYINMQTGEASVYTIKAYHNLSSTWLRVGVLMVFANQAQNTLTQICISNCMVDGGGNLIPNYATNVMNVFYRFKQFSGNPPEGMTIGVWTTWAKFGDSGYQPDNEDIDLNASDQLQFANKSYDTSAFSGLGRVYLRKNIVTLEGTGKNVLTQAMVNTANTIYHIQYDFDLNGQTITLPAGCVLEFDGGSVKNGTLVGNNTSVSAELVKIFFTDITISGSWNITQAYPEWFGAKGDGVTDDSAAMNKVFQFDNVELKNNYLTNETIIVNNEVNVKSAVKSKVQYNKFEIRKKAFFRGITFDGNMSCSGVFIYSNGITFDSCNFLNTKSNGTSTSITSAIFVGDYYTEEAGTVISDITISNCVFDTAEPRDTSFVSSNSTVARFILAYNPYNLKIINNKFSGLNGIYDGDCIQIRTKALPSSEYPFAGSSETWSGASPYYPNTRYMETNTLIDGNYFNMQNTKSAVKIMGSSVIVSNNTVDVSSTETQEDIYAVFRSSDVQNVSYVNNQINLKDIKLMESIFHTTTSKNVVMSGNTVVTTGVVETLNSVILAKVTTNTTISNNVFVILANKLGVLSTECVGDVKIDNNAFSLYDTNTVTEQMIGLFDLRNRTIYPDDNNGGTLCIESNTFICNKKLNLSSSHLNKLALLGNTFKVNNNTEIEANMYMVANADASFVYQGNKSDSYIKFTVGPNATYNQSNVDCSITDANISYLLCANKTATVYLYSNKFDNHYTNHYIALYGNALTVEKCTFIGTIVNFRSNSGTNTVTLMGNTFSSYPRTYIPSGTLQLNFKQSDNLLERVDYGDALPSNAEFNFATGHLYYLAGQTKRPAWYDGTKWLDANGYSPVANKGATSARPTLTSDDAGFTYWDTTLGKMISWNGTAWVNMDGTVLS